MPALEEAGLRPQHYSLDSVSGSGLKVKKEFRVLGLLLKVWDLEFRVCLQEIMHSKQGRDILMYVTTPIRQTEKSTVSTWPKQSFSPGDRPI